MRSLAVRRLPVAQHEPCSVHNAAPAAAELPGLMCACVISTHATSRPAAYVLCQANDGVKLTVLAVVNAGAKGQAVQNLPLAQHEPCAVHNAAPAAAELASLM